MRRTPNIYFTVLIAMVISLLLSLVLPKDKEKYLKGQFWSRKAFAPAKYDVLLMGDSRVYRGLNPEIMSTQLPELKIFNFGFSNGGLNPEMVKAAVSKLNKNSRHRIIVMGVTANSITGYTKNNEQYFQELTRPREEVLEHLYLNPVLYWFSATSPEEIRELFNPVKDSTYYHSDYHLNGYVESDKFPIDTTEAIRSYVDDFTNYKVEPAAIDQLEKSIEKLTKRGIIVIAYRPPISKPLQELEDSLGKYNEEQIERAVEQAGGYWLQLNSTHYKTYDGSHLDKPSTEKLSKQLADEIRSILAKQE
ncbi:hypothetical protein ACUNWD_10825 [Sunxiuqinia sp. A32]|uniref:hypothetical protein n=1 Tax=Sunxiuqinia sp. A32 TaxID=3461496 RepID=UPI004045B173